MNKYLYKDPYMSYLYSTTYIYPKFITYPHNNDYKVKIIYTNPINEELKISIKKIPRLCNLNIKDLT